MSTVLVYPSEQNGVMVLLRPDNTFSEQVISQNVPADMEYKLINMSDLPSEYYLRDAWEYGDTITINMDKAKASAHYQRRAARTSELVPLDEIVAKQIPGESDKAEAKREQIRIKYQGIQNEIDACTTPQQLQQLIVSLKG